MDTYIYKTRWKETNKMFTTDNSIGLQSQRMRKEITNITVCMVYVFTVRLPNGLLNLSPALS